LGYNPKISWKRGLDITVSWYLDYLNSGKKLNESFYDNK
jgi:hypothetical protein